MSEKNSLSAAWRSVARLIYRIWRGGPMLASIWLTLPLFLGALVIPSYTAQKRLIDLIADGEPLVRAWPALAIFTGTAVAKVGLDALHNVIDVKLRDRASQLMQSEVHKRVVAVPLERMDQADYYDRLSRAEGVAGSDLLGVLQNVITAVRLLFELFGLFAVAALAHPVVCILLVLVFVVSFAIRLESDLVKRRLNRDLTRSGRESDYLRETIVKPETIRDMRLSGSIDYLIEKWSGVTSNALELRMNANRREIRRGMLVSAMQIAGLFGAVVWMVQQMKTGAMTAGTLVILLQAMRQAYGMSMRMSFPVGKIYIQSAKLIDLAEFLREPPEHNVAGSAKSPGGSGRIELHEVAYQYSGASEPTVRGIKLTLNPGETVALVGENGAGKSTLVKLLLGLYRPTAGRITWDGVDLAELDPAALRRSMSAAFQDFVRYETTLRDNVGFGRPEERCDDADLRAALDKSGAAAMERLAGSLDARVGLLSAGGRDLSGGQWQRLAIARAALREAQLLVLDEPTAALDPQHESELYRCFRRLAEGRTVLFVSHRLGWARFADRIVVLRDGRIAEQGTHDSLLAGGGEYAAMFRAQAEWYRGA